MAWLYIKLPRGTLKIKPRSHLRSDEIARRVPVLDLGLVILSWWSRARMERDLAERGVGAAQPPASPPTGNGPVLDLASPKTLPHFSHPDFSEGRSD